MPLPTFYFKRCQECDIVKKLTLILSVLIAMALLFTACGNTQKKTEPVSAKPGASIESPGMRITIPPETAEETLIPETAPSTNYMDTVYQEQISRYRKALSEQWDEGRYYEQEMSPLASYYYEGNSLDNIGFAFADLDHDGHQELIIGAIANAEQDPAIFEIWTLRNNIPSLLCQSGYRNRYFLEYAQEEDNWLIANEASNNAANSASLYYYLENGELKVAQAIVFDAIANESAPWFMAYDADWDASNDTPIDEATAISIMEAHRASYAVPDYTPYSLY